ncbi:MAG TPA: hypothetical protein VIF37_19570 [Methylobacter sp.]
MKAAIKRTNLGINKQLWTSHDKHHFGGNLRKAVDKRERNAVYKAAAKR